jgi:hypothetical protein
MTDGSNKRLDRIERKLELIRAFRVAFREESKLLHAALQTQRQLELLRRNTWRNTGTLNPFAADSKRSAERSQLWGLRFANSGITWRRCARTPTPA